MNKLIVIIIVIVIANLAIKPLSNSFRESVKSAQVSHSLRLAQIEKF